MVPDERDGVASHPPEPADDEPLTPEDDEAIRAALDRIDAGGELVDGETWMAAWIERLGAQWPRTG